MHPTIYKITLILSAIVYYKYPISVHIKILQFSFILAIIWLNPCYFSNCVGTIPMGRDFRTIIIICAIPFKSLKFFISIEIFNSTNIFRAIRKNHCYCV